MENCHVLFSLVERRLLAPGGHYLVSDLSLFMSCVLQDFLLGQVDRWPGNREEREQETTEGIKQTNNKPTVFLKTANRGHYPS